MEIETARRPPPPPPAAAVAAAAAAAMFLVLGDDDLLREILLRLGLPTSLLGAALVCRRWYRHASDPAFLRRFRDRHPPPVLGVYVNTEGWPLPRFFPIRPLQELATVVRRAGSFFDAFAVSSAFVHDSRGGRLLVTILEDEYSYSNPTHLLCSPLSTAGNAIVVPPVPRRPPAQLTSPDDGIIYHYCASVPDGGDGRSYLCVMTGYSEQAQQITLCMYELQDMCWVARASVAAQLPVSPSRLRVALFDDSKFYIFTTTNEILVCDFPSSSISAMELPNGVENNHSDSIMLSRRDGSGIYLIHVKESLLRVFHSDNAGNWFLVHSICLREVCANLDMADWPSLHRHAHGVKIHAVGDNAKFVFLKMFGTIVFLDTTSKQAEKVYKMMPEDDALVSVHPLMLIWPPVFPQLKEGNHQ